MQLAFLLMEYVTELRDITSDCQRITDGEKCIQCREKDRLIERVEDMLNSECPTLYRQWKQATHNEPQRGKAIPIAEAT